VSFLNSANVNANIKSDGVVYRKITIGKTPVSVKLENGKLNLAITNAVLYQGTGTINISADSANAFEMNAAFKGVQAEPLLSDAAITDKFSGAADLDLNFNSHGHSQKEIISALAGNGSFKINNGELKGVNLGDMLHNVQSAFGVAGNDASAKTVFTALNGTFTATAGVITNKDLTANTSGVNVAGQGDVNLPAYTISYRLTPQVVTSAKDATGKATQKQGLAVPVVIEGSLDNPKYRPDVGSVLQNALSNPSQFKDQLKNSKGALGTTNLKGLLNGLR